MNGHRQVRTPHLDALARRGVNFTRAFVQNPICTPSRMCYLSGQYAHNHGVFGLTGNERVPAGLPSLFSVFRAAGYRTGIVGHVHVAASWLQPHCDQYRDLHDESRPGDTPYDRYLKAKGLLQLRDDEAYRGRSQILDACASELAFEDTHEGYCLQSLSDFLAELPAEQPFLYQLDPLHPHQNYLPARPFWELYDGVELELPPSADEDLSSKPPHQQRLLERHHNYDWVFEPRTYEAGRRRKLQGYYGCISQVDHLVGLALQRLQELGRADNTIVVYCSDHGDFALEHGFPGKGARNQLRRHHPGAVHLELARGRAGRRGDGGRAGGERRPVPYPVPTGGGGGAGHPRRLRPLPPAARREGRGARVRRYRVPAEPHHPHPRLEVVPSAARHVCAGRR